MDLQPIAIIPARRGSRRLPDKNFRLLGGRPLVDWTLAAAYGSGIFQPWDIRVLSAGRVYDPEETIEDLLRTLTWTTEQIIYVLTPTSPFRSSQSIRLAWTKWCNEGRAGLLSIRPVSFPSAWMVDSEGTPIFPDKYILPRHRIGAVECRPDGGHLILRPDALSVPIERRRMSVFLTPPEESLDIDTEDDLRYAECLLHHARS